MIILSTTRLAIRDVASAAAGAVSIGILLYIAPAAAGPDITREFSLGGSTDGCSGGDCAGPRIYQLEGAVEAISSGYDAINGDTGGDVNLFASSGTYTATVGNDPGLVGRFSSWFVGSSDPWSVGILAASYGVDGGLQTNTQSLYNGGNGGAVSVDAGSISGIPLTVNLGGNLPSLEGALTLTGVMALSQGGVNSYMDARPDNYSESGDGGAVDVDFTGIIRSSGSYSSSAGELVAREVGISAISRGGAFRCINEDCADSYQVDYNFNLPGQGGRVDVTLGALPTDGAVEIDLQNGSAIGVMAISSNGAIIADQDDAGFNVDASRVQAGAVNVTVDPGATIKVGNDDAGFSSGILAVSSGSELTVPLYYQNADVTLRPSGGSGYGNDVTVTHNGDITARGELAVGIAALSVGGEAAVGLRGITSPGIYEQGKKHPEWLDTTSPLGNVRVTNGGAITTIGESANGIVAASLGAGGITRISEVDEQLMPDPLDPDADIDSDGLLNKDDDDDDGDGIADPEDTDDDNDSFLDASSCEVEGGAPGELPYCEGVQTAYVLGQSSGGSPRPAGAVTVDNSGTITTGLESDPESSAHAVGILAQSVGGGGGNVSGRFWFSIGGTARDGGWGRNGGAVDVTNSGEISTFGDFATGLIAQSIGGDGGSAGSNKTIPFVSVGGQGGRGGDGAAVTVHLFDGNATDGAVDAREGGSITTAGAFAQGVLAQSIGGGGGTGGNAQSIGLGLAVDVGGAAGDGGSAGPVTVIGHDNHDAAFDAATGSLDLEKLEIRTEGDHATGILAQSIGGGGGVGGHARSLSASVLLDFNLSFGGRGGSGGIGGPVTVDSVMDIATDGDDASGILAQSIGGGGGAGGHAYSNALTVEIPTGDLPLINLTYTGAFGGRGGEGNRASDVAVYNGGFIGTRGESALGVLAQSIGGGGGSGGAATAINRAVPIAGKKDTVAINVSTAVGGNGGRGGDAGQVIVHNASTDDDNQIQSGIIRTLGDHGAGLAAQSIGGGGGNGGHAQAANYTLTLGKLLTASSETKSVFALDATVAVGGTGGAGGNGGYAQVYNGEQIWLADEGRFSITPGSIDTRGGNAPGMLVQSIGGGGGMGGEGAVSGLGGLVNVNVGVGGSGGSSGNGAAVYALNPAGASIRTGEVLVGEASEEEVASGASPFVAMTRGAGSVGIFAQSIGGGGGDGGNADASSALGDDWESDIALLVTYIDFGKTIKELAKNWSEDGAKWEAAKEALKANFDLAVGGSGGTAGNGGAVLVDNGGSVETYGEQAHGILAQSIGGGGGRGGAVDAANAAWTSKAAALPGVLEFTLGMSVGGAGGNAGSGGTVTVNHYAGASIETHGYGADGILAQSIGGGGGYGGAANTNSEGFFFIGAREQGKEGGTGRGDVVSVSSAGTIETWGDDASGILAQSIGGSGGHGVVGCTQSEDGFPIGLGPWGGQSPCWGNSESEDGESADIKDWSGAWISLQFNVGGARSYSTDTGDDGGAVSVHVSDGIITHGNRSMGVVAQSIGGGGGFVGAEATAVEESLVAPSAGYSHSHGSRVEVALDAGGSITTWGDGAWGVLAQSIGGSGGFAGDSSLDLGLLVSNTIDTVCCDHKVSFFDEVLGVFRIENYDFTTGADGGAVTVNLASGTSITTHGRNAHGIFAQSVGGGGGIAAGWDNDPEARVYAGNPLAPEWNGQNADDPIWWTGQGGNVSIDIAEGARVDVQGENAIGIIAQSTGDRNYQSTIAINVAGTVTGGPGDADALLLGPAAILVSGGQSENNRHGFTPNTITVQSTGTVAGYGYLGTSTAIRAIHGHTDVLNHGLIVGAIKLGFASGDADLGSFTNDGTWVAGTTNIFSNNSVHNYGLIEIVQPTTIEGSLKHYASGELSVHLDPALHFDQAALTVSGLARIEGKITPVLDTLLPGEFRLLKAGSLEASASIDNPFLFDWQQRVTTDGELRLSAEADFKPADVNLSANQQQTAAYLERAWENADPYLSGHFAYMLRMESAAQHTGMLDALGGAELLHQHGATLAAIPTLLGDAIDCPTMGGADVIVGEDSCAWMGMGQSWGRYSGKDTRRNDTDGDLFSAGLQKEFRPGWFLSGVIGRLSSDADAGNARSAGRTTLGSVGLKHQSGNWILGASLAWGEGSYDSVRSFALPLAGGSSAPDATFRSDSDMDIRALRTRVSYEFGVGGGYLRPTLDLDALQTETSGFEEEAGAHLFRLRADGDSKNEVVVTPHMEAGRLFDLGGENRLRAYVDAGVRLAPDADREMDIRIAGADAAIGFMRNRMDVPLATGLLKVGAQVYRNDALDLRLEYGLEANDDFRNETATARVAWHF